MMTRSLFDRAGSPEAVLRAVRELSHPSAAAVDDLDAAIAAARLQVRDHGAFDRRLRGDLSFASRTTCMVSIVDIGPVYGCSSIPSTRSG
jgi:hypothetical protein